MEEDEDGDDDEFDETQETQGHDDDECVIIDGQLQFIHPQWKECN